MIAPCRGAGQISSDWETSGEGDNRNEARKSKLRAGERTGLREKS